MAQLLNNASTGQPLHSIYKSEEAIVDLYEQGFSAKFIGERYGAVAGTVYNLLNKNGVTIRKGGNHWCGKVIEDKIVKLYKLHGSIFKICCDADIKLPYAKVYGVLQRHNYL